MDFGRIFKLVILKLSLSNDLLKVGANFENDFWSCHCQFARMINGLN